jgi:hypothetical protein
VDLPAPSAQNEVSLAAAIAGTVTAVKHAFELLQAQTPEACSVDAAGAASKRPAVQLQHPAQQSLAESPEGPSAHNDAVLSSPAAISPAVPVVAAEQRMALASTQDELAAMTPQSNKLRHTSYGHGQVASGVDGRLSSSAISIAGEQRELQVQPPDQQPDAVLDQNEQLLCSSMLKQLTSAISPAVADDTSLPPAHGNEARVLVEQLQQMTIAEPFDKQSQQQQQEQQQAPSQQDRMLMAITPMKATEVEQLLKGQPSQQQQVAELMAQQWAQQAAASQLAQLEAVATALAQLTPLQRMLQACDQSVSIARQLCNKTSS